MKLVDQIKQKFQHYRELASYEHAPFSAKVLMFAAVCYLISPIDLIPDFIPIIGFLDDLIIVPLLLNMAFKQIEAEKMKRIGMEREKEALGQISPDHCETQG